MIFCAVLITGSDALSTIDHGTSLRFIYSISSKSHKFVINIKTNYVIIYDEK